MRKIARSSPSVNNHCQNLVAINKFLEEIGSFLGFQTAEDWYKLSIMDVPKPVQLRSILSMHDNSPSKLLLNLYPSHKFLDWKFTNIKMNWNSKENQINFMDWLGIEMGFKDREDWYKFDRKTISSKGGSNLLSKYKNSPISLVISTYPSHRWLILNFENHRIPKGYWKSYDNRRFFMDYLGVQLGFKTMEDWYRISKNDVSSGGGRKLLEKFSKESEEGSSLYHLVMDTYPQHEWVSWKFRRSANWEIKEERIKRIRYLTQELKIKSLEEWYNIPWKEILSKLSFEFFKSFPLEDVLKETYPNHNWDFIKLKSKNSKVSQGRLRKTIEDIFFHSGDILIFCSNGGRGQRKLLAGRGKNKEED